MDAIEARGFTLRPFYKRDEESLAINANNPKVYRGIMELPFPYRRSDAREWIERNRREARRKSPTMVNFVIEVEGRAVGCIGLGSMEEHRAEIGYWLGEDYWGRGITTRAVKLVSRYAFDELGKVRLFAHVFTFNKASMRVLEKAGYRREGLLRKAALKDGRAKDMVLFAKVR